LSETSQLILVKKQIV